MTRKSTVNLAGVLTEICIYASSTDESFCIVILLYLVLTRRRPYKWRCLLYMHMSLTKDICPFIFRDSPLNFSKVISSKKCILGQHILLLVMPTGRINLSSSFSGAPWHSLYSLTYYNTHFMVLKDIFPASSTGSTATFRFLQPGSYGYASASPRNPDLRLGCRALSLWVFTLLCDLFPWVWAGCKVLA